MKKYFGLYILFAFYSMFALGQEVDSIPIRFLEQLKLFPQEKVFVHTDKTNYIAGDTIWLRAHLADAVTHIPSPVSRYVYVELANNADSVVSRIKIRANDSIYRGQIPLNLLTAQGYYTLRAYTGFMKSLSEDYLFKTTLSISNHISEELQQKVDASNQNASVFSGYGDGTIPYDVSFFPEGGYLSVNVPCRVAFKAIGTDGWNETITGEISDEATDEIVATFATSYLGMGSFIFTPVEGKQYVARCTNSRHRFLKFNLPKAIAGVSILNANWRKRTLMVSLSQPAIKPIRLVMQNRGLVFYSELLKPTQKALSFDAQMLPAGVIQILLVDENKQPISERLVFNKNLNDIQFGFNTDQTTYGTRQPVKASISITDEEGNALKGNFSVSVTDDAAVNMDNATSILSYLLLTSELRGTIEFPEAYFDNERKQADGNLDLLMMTQGWRRYDISKVLKEDYERPTSLLEISQEISGKVLDEINLKPKVNCPVSLFAPKQLFSDETFTDSTGHFRFSRFEFPDSTNYVVKGLSKKGGESNILVQLDKETFYPFEKSLSVADLYQRKEVAEEYNVDTLSDKGIQMIQLDEVVVKAKAIERKGKSMFHSITSKVYSADKLMNPRPSTMADMLARLPGVAVIGGSITLRGNTPLILLDDIEFGFDVIRDLQPDDVDEIELMKDASVAIFGSKGAGGVIVITTKTGDINKIMIKANMASFHPLGYQKPIEFYSPKYATNQPFLSKTQDKRTTLYWNPCVNLSEDGKGQFEFFTADRQTSYTVIMQGLTTDGRIIYRKSKLNEAAK